MANIVTDYSAVGDGEYAVAVLTLSGTALSSTTAIWSAGDAGKAIAVPAGNGLNPHLTTIATFTDAQHIVLGSAAPSSYSGQNHIVMWGTNNATAFDNFRVAEAGNTVSLTIPAGVYYIQQSLDAQIVLFRGISNLTIEGAGATLALGLVGSLGTAAGIAETNTGHARTQSAVAGATSVTLVTAGEASRFTVGQYALMTGLDMQGLGYPCNPHFFDYVLVSNISGGVITFATTPLTNNYLSTWPHYNDGNASQLDQGGPATLYALPASWNSAMTVNNLTYAQDLPTGCVGRTITFNGCTFVGATGVTNTGPFPTQNETLAFNNCTMTDCEMEVDKLIKSCTLSNCVIKTVQVQSSSVDQLTISGGSVVQLVVGTGKRTTLADSTIVTLKPGPTTYGRADSMSITNCAITTFGTGFPLGGSLDKGEGDAGINLSSGVTMSGGVISLPAGYRDNNGAVFWAVPGTICFWADTNNWIETSFRIISVSQPGGIGNPTLVQTNMGGGFLTPPFGATAQWVMVHPCPSLTVRNCTGADQITGLNNAPAERPMGSCFNTTYTSGVDHAAEQGPGWTWGKLVRLSINVTHAYAGAGTLTFIPGLNFVVIRADNSNPLQYYNATIDAKTAGERVITIAATSGSGGADNINTMPSPQAWFTHGPVSSGPKYSTDVSGTDPDVSVTLTWELEQFAETVAGYGGRMAVFVSTY